MNSTRERINIKRVFLIVADSLGIGAAPDAEKYGDLGCCTLRAAAASKYFCAPFLSKMGLFNIDGIDFGKKADKPLCTYGRLTELSCGKDTTTGHWEIAGIVSGTPFPTYPNGFPPEIIGSFEELTGRRVLCNKPYSGTEVIADYGREHLKTGGLIVYTSADSVFQIAAHEDIVPRELLYEYCSLARGILCGKHRVGRVIARPFVGEYPSFKRTDGRRDFSVSPPKPTMLNAISEQGGQVISVGKIYDIFNGSGITSSYHTSSNTEGLAVLSKLAESDFSGLCFVNLVDFDMLYGHRNDIDGYAKAINELDRALEPLLTQLSEEDVLILTADHGCDPSHPGTDHTREYTPLLIYGKQIPPQNLGTISGFTHIARAVTEILGVKYTVNEA